MEGGIVYTSKPDHTCRPPSDSEFLSGDIFECSRCKMWFILKDDQRDGRFWMAQ